MQTIKKKSHLALAVAAALGSAAADATVWQAQLTAVQRWNGAQNGAAGNITSSTATWSYDDVTGLLTQTAGTFNVRFTTTPTSTLFRHSITGLVLGNAGAASATTFNCVEGNFGLGVAASLCGTYDFGGDDVNNSTTAWGPGTATARTLGGDDTANQFLPSSNSGYFYANLGNAVHGITDYDGFTTVSLVGPTLTLSNAACNLFLPYSASACSATGGFNTGFRWTLTLSTPPAAVAADDGPIAVIEGVETVIAVGANDTGFTGPVTVTVTTPPGNGTIAAVSSPGPAAGMTVSYTANIGATGTDSFVYEMSDATPASDPAIVSLSITPADTAPAAFAFTDQTGVAQSSPITSNAVPITGINVPAAISVTGGEYSIGCTATFTTTAGTIANGSTVCVRHVSAAAPLTATSTTLTVGGVSDTFTTTTANAGPGSVEIVSNLGQPYDFGAGLGSAFVQASSFTTGSQAYRLDSVALVLQVNSASTASLRLFTDSAGLPGVLLKDLGTQAVNAGEQDVVFSATGTTVLLPNTKYWLLVEQVGGGSVQWVSTYSTVESSLVGVTIGDAMFYRPVAGTTWSPQPTATEAGQFSVSGTLTADTDADGVYDVLDNCTLRPNTNQCDSDGDGYGNRCDGDFGNPVPGNGSTNSQDNVLFRAQLGQPSIGPTFNKADLNCNGVVNSQDSTLFKQLLGSPPGPSGLHP